MSTIEGAYVPKEDRKRAILSFLDEADLVLTPSVIYINMQMEGATFSERTVHRLLSELVDEGAVERPKRGYYKISDEGRERVNSH